MQKPHWRPWCSVERLLQRVQRAVGRGEPLDGADLGAVGGRREHQARADRRAVDEHRAAAADAVLAPDVRAGEPELVAEHVREQVARLDLDAVLGAVDVQRDLDHAGPP